MYIVCSFQMRDCHLDLKVTWVKAMTMNGRILLPLRRKRETKSSSIKSKRTWKNRRLGQHIDPQTGTINTSQMILWNLSPSKRAFSHLPPKTKSWTETVFEFKEGKVTFRLKFGNISILSWWGLLALAKRPTWNASCGSTSRKISR